MICSGAVVDVIHERHQSGEVPSVSLLSFRRSQFIAAPPVAGNLIRTRSGKGSLRVTKTTVFRRQGEPVGRDIIRLQVERQPKSGLDDAAILPWPIAARAAPIPAALPAVARFHLEAAKSATSTATPRSRKQIKRDLMREAREFQDDQDSVVPRAQRTAVMAPDGSVFCPPKVTAGSWQDVEQNRNSRAPKMTHGFRRCDPLVVLAKSNSNVTMSHVLAADAYRMQWEKGPGGAVGGSRELNYSDRGFHPSMGPAERHLQHMANWVWTQRQLSQSMQACLQFIVLDRQTITAWALSSKQDRRYAVGFLLAALDQLLLLFKDEVDTLLAQERVSFD
jgi:hypothetical protein